MGFVVSSSTGDALPEDAMRRLVEVVDGCRGVEGVVFVVFRNEFPYEAISLHGEEKAAKKAAASQAGLSYFGPVEPSDPPPNFVAIKKTTGTTFKPLERPISRVVVFDTNNEELAEFNVNLEGRLTDPQNDIEALFFTQSSVDKYAIPYVTRVYGVDYAAERRREWIKKEESRPSTGAA
jgi:hypothetical protein